MRELCKWDERFLAMAFSAASWSKDPGTKVGCVLVVNRRIIATGYNGFPAGIDDSPERYADRQTKLALTVHAEMNAILNAAAAGAKTEGADLYVTFPPCVNCSTCIIQAGIDTVVCPSVESAPERWRESFAAGREVLKEGGIKIINYTP